MSYDRRATRRSDPVAFADAKLGVRVWKPKDPDGPKPDCGWRYSYPDPDTGIRKSSRWYGTRDEVRRQYKALCKDLEASRDMDWRARPFRELADLYLADPDHDWEPNVRRGQTQKVGVLCDDTLLGDMPVGKLAYSPKTNRDALRELSQRVSDRTGRPFAASSLKTYRDLLGTVYSWAQKEEYIPAELAPMKGVGVPKAAAGVKLARRATLLVDDDEDDVDGARGLIAPSEIPALEDSRQLSKVWAERTTQQHWYRELDVELAATSGMRWGEQHALQPRDLVFGEDGLIRVHRKLVVDASGNVSTTSLPKGRKKREALLPPHLEEGLERRCWEVERTHGKTGWLFPSPTDPSKPYAPDSFTSSMRRFAPMAGWPVDEHGLLVWTWHSLRHTAAVVQLRDMRIEPAMVSEGLGHASVTFTLDRYVGTTSNSRQLARGQMLRWKKEQGL